MNTNPTPEQLAKRKTVRYQMFVAQCPSLKNYLYTTYSEGHSSREQHVAFVQKIMQPRRVLPIYSYVLTKVLLETFNPN